VGVNIFLNDRLVPEGEATVSVYDHGFLYGDGIYETMRSYRGVVFMLERHLDRLCRSALFIGLNIPEKSDIKRAVYLTLKQNNLSESYVRITVSRGKGAIGIDPDLCKAVTFVVIAEPFRKYPDELYAEGARLILAETRRNSTTAIDPRIKSLNFLNNILAKIEAKKSDAHEAIMLNSEGFIAEGTVSNIFFVKNGILCTPSVKVGILDGITREIVISSARDHGVRVEEGEYRPEDLLKASEVFFTNTSAEIMPVSKVEDVDFGIGEITSFLHTLYQDEVQKYVDEHSGYQP
jgi:branched-chain amino acid aminotransferase